MSSDTLGERILERRDKVASVGDTARQEAVEAAQALVDDAKDYLQTQSQNYAENIKTAVIGYVNQQISIARSYVDGQITALRNTAKTYVDNRIAKLAADNNLTNNP